MVEINAHNRLAATDDSFDKALAIQDDLNKRMDEASKRLELFVQKQGGARANGLTPDSIKQLPEYRKLKQEVDLSFRRLQDFNKQFVKKYKKEIREHYQNKRKTGK